MSFINKLNNIKAKTDRLDDNNEYVFSSFNKLNSSIIGESTIALLAGTAVPVAGPNSSEKRKFNSLFYYFSLTQIYSIFDLVNEKLGLPNDPSFRQIVKNIKEKKTSIDVLFEKLKKNCISFIDTISQFETNENYEYGDDKLLDFRLDFEAFKNLKNVKIVFANSSRTKEALKIIFDKLSLDVKVVPLYIFKHGVTNEEIATLIVKEIEGKN